MRLKEIDTEMITDSNCKEILVVMECENLSRITIDRNRDMIIIGFCQGHQYYELYIYLNGDIKYYRCATPINIPELSMVMHLIQETQWIDPKVELPGNQEDIYIKTQAGILKSRYTGFKNGYVFPIYNWKKTDSDMNNLLPCNISNAVFGWLLADNVEI